tara:strand:+ start:1709 stop:2515 length:807 start_codon:yes stop_codon:yes gene_type:complete
MGRTLFVGCSHTMGYREDAPKDQSNIWRDNNYAEIYSQINDKKIVITASAGVGNRAYPRFLSYAFEKYNDIDEVFIQSTYWGRFPIAINPDLDAQSIFSNEFFIDKNFSSKNIDRFSIALSPNNKYLETYLKPWSSDYDDFPYMKDTKVWETEPDIRRTSHIYMQMWHYSNTHLEQEDYFTYMTMCDMLCTKNNANMYIWNINPRCFIPKQTKDYYAVLDKTKIAPIDAENYLKKYIKIDTVDGEHYSTDVHDAIAKRYIPYVKEKAW